MAELLSSVGEVFTSMIGWAGTVGSTIAGYTTTEGGEVVFNNPVLVLFCVAIPVCGLGIGCFRRLLSSRG